MTALPGTNVAAPILPYTDADDYATHDALYGKGGFRSVATLAARDAIPAKRRVSGMRVRVTADGTPANNVDWELGADLTTWTDVGSANKTNIQANTDAIALRELLANKATDLTSPNNVKFPTTQAVVNAIAAAVANLINSAPGALDTLKELADAIGDDASFAATITNSLATINTALSAKAAKALNLTGQGLVQAIGDLSADRAVNVPIASPADVLAATNNAKAVTPQAMAAQVAAIITLISRFVDGDGAIVSSDPNGLINGLLDIWFKGANGNMPFGIQTDGTVIAEVLRARAVTILGNLLVNGSDVSAVLSSLIPVASPPVVANDPLGLVTGRIDMQITGANGNAGLLIQDDGTAIIPVLRVGSLVNLGPSTASLSAIDAQNLARSAAYKSRMITGIQRATAQYNVKEVNGQSLGEGDETWPALSVTNQYGNKMLGGNVMPSTYGTLGDSFVPFTSSAFQNLSAITRSATTGALLNTSGEAALAPGDLSSGESPIHGWCNAAKFYLNQKLLLENDTARSFVGIVTARGGTTIEQNSKWSTGGLLTCGLAQQDTTNRYAAAIDGLTKIKAAATALGATCVMTTSLWAQGENNRNGGHGGTWDKASYKLLEKQYLTDKSADIMSIFAQSLPPLMLTYQTSGSWVTDIDSFNAPGSHIAMAQLEAVAETPNARMVGPMYPYTDKGGHLDSNGSRWFGNQVAKVEHKIQVEGQDWDPVKPVKFEMLSPRQILIHHHVPEPPLQWRMPYVVSAATDYVDKGFRVTDKAGGVTIISVGLAGQTLVLITLARDLVLPSITDPAVGGYDVTQMPHVWYADHTAHNGNGCLFDSDATVAHDNYTYVTGSGMYTAANIPELVNKPYPLNNPCVVYYYPVNYTEIG